MVFTRRCINLCGECNRWNRTYTSSQFSGLFLCIVSTFDRFFHVTALLLLLTHHEFFRLNSCPFIACSVSGQHICVDPVI